MLLSIEVEHEIINISIGCVLKLKRLELGLSQHDVAIAVNTDSTSIGRIERSEHFSSWPMIHLIAKHLDINFASLFELRPHAEIVAILDKCYTLEKRLTKDKKKFYQTLHDRLDSLRP